MKLGAREGDTVRVFFRIEESGLEGKITYTPQATGDSWVLVEKDGTIHNIQQFEMMTVLNRKQTEGK